MMLTDWILRLRSLFNRRAVDQDLDDELRFHLEQQVTLYVGQGMAHDDALRRARLELGGLDQVKEEHRDARGIGPVDDLVRDVQYATRQLRRSPGFALLAMLCLGLGIGVNTAIFGVINSVLLRQMPVADPERLIVISRGERTAWSYPDYRDFRDRSRTLSGLAGSWPMESDLDVDGDSAFVGAEVASADYGDVLGVTPVLGRWFADDREPFAVISHAAWERWFHRSPQVLGRRIRSQSESYTVVGVAPPDCTGAFAPLRTDIWVPIRTRPGLAAQLEDREDRHLIMLFGRLRAGATAVEASTELNAIDAQLRAEHARASERQPPIVADEARGIPDHEFRRSAATLATLLAVVVGLVLLIACVNVGNLLLVRGAIRQREFAMRRALGATQSRLFRQLLTESLMLAIGGGICGVVLAVWTNQLLERSVSSFMGYFAVQLDLSLDWRTIVFATMVSFAATLLCGWLPAWRASRSSGVVAFKGEIGGGTRRRRPLGLVAQVAMSLVLLFVAGSFLQGLVRLQATDPGFEVDGRLIAYAFIPSSPITAERRREVYAQALERLRTLPGVRTATLTSTVPLMWARSDCASLRTGPQIRITTSTIDTSFFDTMAIRLLAGRRFGVEDLSSNASTVVVNESLARRILPNSTAVGERLMIGCDDTQAAVVVGVVRNSAIRELGEPPEPHLYFPFPRQDFDGLAAILLQTSTDPATMAQPVRRTLLGMGQGMRAYVVQPLSAHIERRYAQFEWIVNVLTVFGLLALLLAAVGLYGVIAYHVTLRTQEIGVRMALGATRQDIFRDVVSNGLAIVLVGVAIGELLTAGLTGVAGSIQEGIAPTGVWTHVVVAFIWIGVALGACCLPAARAARVDPLVALRYE
ncbi:MAG: FtsX-like permease family protein [Luteitalea sp.]|nr:FtsX-like permease family protein [Luteitalea sp.]